MTLGDYHEHEAALERAALWHAEATDRESRNDHHRMDYGRPLRTAASHGESLTNAIEAAVAGLETGR